MKMKDFLFLALLIFLSSCANNQGKILEYKNYLTSSNYDQALKFLRESSLYSDEESRLLKHLELGTLYFNNGSYFQALREFDLAREISDKNFTVSVSKKTVGTLLDESQDVYYGENYERSLLRYYTMLSHYMLYSKGEYEEHEDLLYDDKGKIKERKIIGKVVLDESKKRFHLMASRAMVLEWNSILEQMKNDSAGEVTYKDDLLAKFVGATIHQKVGTSGDRQIALSLYKESQNTIYRYYNSFESFNLKYKDFNKDFSTLHTLAQKEGEKKYVEATKLSKEVLDFAQKNVNEWNKKEKDNVQIIWHQGHIASKEIKQYNFPIGIGTFKVSVGTQADFLTFSRAVLSVSTGIIPSVSFQMATIPYRKNNDVFKFIIKQNEKVILEKDALLVDPLSEMAHYAVDSRSLKESAIKGARIAAKHLTALGASYLTYNKLKEGAGPDFAMLSAAAAYHLSTRGIEATEQADLRSWMTLPNQIRLNSFRLSPGIYEVYTKSDIGQERLLGRISVGDAKDLDLKILIK